VAADFTKLVTLSNASPVAVTLPDEATVPWPTGTQLRLLNQGAGTVTVAGAVGVTINGTPLTLAQYKGAVLTKTGTDTWTFLPFSGGSADAVISSTTGSPSITSYASGGITYDIYDFTGSGTIVVGTPGIATVLAVAGGGGGQINGGGGGAGGYVEQSNVFLTGTMTVTVGAGGAAKANGQSSIVGNACVAVGGGVGTREALTNYGGSGAGASSDAVSLAGAGVATQGNNGGARNTDAGGGGGGASAAGAAATSGAGGAGGAGTASTILDGSTSVTRAGGGGGGGNSSGGAGGAGGGGAGSSTTGTAGDANTGGGGGGGYNAASAAGGSGRVIIKVAR
jgi:hypothetical protein